MDINTVGTKLLEGIKRFRYPLLVLVVGIVLMLLPGEREAAQKAPQTTQATQEKADITQQLEQILGQIQGVGKVKVMLTQAEGESYRYQYDEDVSMSDGSSTSRKDTVIITDADRNETPVISQILPPKYLGAVIVCQGAENASVKLAVVEAVARITGLGADMISVLKMK